MIGAVLLCIVGGGLGLAVGLHAKKRRLYEQTRGDVLLKKSPNALKGVDLFVLAAGILTKYIPGTPGYRSTLNRAKEEQRFALPVINVHGVLRLDEGDVERFNAAVNVQQQRKSDNPMFLVAATAPLIIFILSLHDCPVKPLGAVNTRNVFRFVRPDECRDVEALLKLSRQGKLRYRASFGGEKRAGIRRKRGMEFCIHIDLFDDGQEPLLTQELYFLQFLKSSVQPVYKDDAAAAAEDDDDDTKSNVKNTLFFDLPKLSVRSPRLWAASCGDYNPIHISVLAAKLFGFPSVIAHGNHVVALAFSGSASSRPAVLSGSKSFTLDVRFVKPMLLPVQLRVTWSERQTGVRSSHTLRICNSSEKDHILGTLT